ncbi:MAG TPA: hypothetical protein PLH84_05345 [Candidatus Krumholzibacteria bacterium]|nr:hypothetical protein [Candidatus Krumholzibacteria bacterium]
MIRRAALPLLLLNLALAGCTPDTVSRVTPLSDDVTWHRGLAVTRTADAVLRLAAAPAELGRSRLHFQVEVANISDRPVEVGPSMFSLIPAGDGPVAVPVDPEARLLQINRQDTKDTSHHDLFGFLDAVGDLASSPDEEELEAREAEEAEEVQRRSAVAESRSFWADQAFRRTTLAPGQTMGGVLVFPAKDCGREVRLTLRTAESELALPYRVMWRSEVTRPPSGPVYGVDP